MSEYRLRTEAHLNPHLFDVGIVEEPIRTGYGEGLLLAGKENEHVVALCADLKESTKTDLFAKEYPQRFIEMGIGEQNMAAVASGMAAMGKIPFMTSYAMFNPGRNWEQIRTTICYNDQNVKIIGSHAGVSVGPDGGTHQALEDIALMRVLPRMTVIVPADTIEARKATRAAAQHKGAVYIRLAREKSPVISTDDTPFTIGSASLLWGGGAANVALFACGGLVYQALRAARTLADMNISSTVVNVSTIKPLDKKTILDAVKDARAVVTVEEHQINGGLGGAIAELLGSSHPIQMEMVAVKDQFGQSGEPKELIHEYGLDEEGIVQATQNLLLRLR